MHQEYKAYQEDINSKKVKGGSNLFFAILQYELCAWFLKLILQIWRKSILEYNNKSCIFGFSLS